MKFATRRDGTRDGELLLVSRDNRTAVSAREIAPNLQALLDAWDERRAAALSLYEALCRGEAPGAFPLKVSALLSPLPRAYAFIDGSAYIHHIVLVRRARGAEPPPTLRTDPLVYQGGSDAFLSPTADIPVFDSEWGADFESEVCIVTGDVPEGTPAAEAGAHVRLLMLCNDVTLRNLVPSELAKGFGFYHSKPPSAFSPLAITPDELGPAWREGRVHLPLRTWLNGEVFGEPNAGPEMHFGFHELLQHCAHTRPLAAGTIIGSGTVSNEDRAAGSSCLAERRMLEVIDHGRAETPLLRPGDRVRIEMLTEDGHSLFLAIEQTVTQGRRPAWT
jgi:fumarylacetoacetate (FAA) hydrolase